MKLLDSIQMSFNDLKNRKLRTFITTFSISIGVALIIIMGALGQGLKNFGDIALNNMTNLNLIQVSPYTNKNKERVDKKIEETTINKIKDIDNVTGVRVQLESNITSTEIGNKKGRKSSIVGVDLSKNIFFDSEKRVIENNPENKNGEPIVAGEILNKNDTKGVLVGEKYLKRLGITNKEAVGKTIKLKVEIPNMEPFIIEGKIKGVINKLYDESRSIIVPMDMASKIQDFVSGEKDYLKKHGPSLVVVEGKNADSIEGIENKIKAFKYSTYSRVKDIEANDIQMKVLNALLMAGGIIVLLVSSIGVINTMSMAVFEKTKSIGIMKALGASKRNIKGIFLVQSGVLGFIGGVLGFVISLLVSNSGDKILLNMLKNKMPFKVDSLFIINSNIVIGSIALAIIVSIIAGLLPASRASKLDPVETLSYE